MGQQPLSEQGVAMHTLQKYTFNCSSGQCVWELCFSLSGYTFQQVLTSNPWFSFPSSCPYFSPCKSL